MNVFRFRLQKILEFREHRERESATRLADARQAADLAKQAQDALEELRKDSVRGIAEGATRSQAVGELRSIGLVVEHINRQIQDARGVANAADDTVRRMVEEFSVAFGERRAMDILRDRQHDEWKADEADKDRKAMDSAAMTRFNRSITVTTAKPW